MGDDRARPAAVAGGAALLAFVRKGERLLRGALGDRHALQADRKPRLVHHGEHAGHAAVFLADEEAGRAAPVAEHHGAGGRGVNAKLVLDGVGAHIVARAERTVRIDQELRDEEQRNALGAGRRIRQPRQHEVDDIVGEIVLAIGDEDLLSADAIAAVAAHARRWRAMRPHRSRPAARSVAWCRSIRPTRAWAGRLAAAHRSHAPRGRRSRSWSAPARCRMPWRRHSTSRRRRR